MWDPLFPDKTIKQIERYCAFQDRSSQDVREKLKSLGVPLAKMNEILGKLTEEGFIDDRRFVRSFVAGKFRQNKWGRVKIVYGLKSKGIPEALIREGIGSIDPDDYRNTLISLIARKRIEIKQEKNLNVRGKIVNFALAKGYEMPLILEIIKEIQPEP
jgi:regulatory protein